MLLARELVVDTGAVCPHAFWTMMVTGRLRGNCLTPLGDDGRRSSTAGTLQQRGCDAVSAVNRLCELRLGVTSLLGEGSSFAMRTGQPATCLWAKIKEVTLS